MAFFRGLGSLFGGGGKSGGRGFNWGNALLGLVGGPGVAQALQHRRRTSLAEAEAEREQQAEGSRMAALAGMRDRQGRPLFTKEMIAGMREEEASRLALEHYQPRQFASGGGSVLDPRSGEFTQAPSRHESYGTVFDVPGGPGEATVRRRGHQMVPVQPGGRVEVIDSWDPFGEAPATTAPTAAPTTATPQGQPAPLDEAALRERARQAILRGADPREVNARLDQLLRGRR
jgi:hypothetical protein